MNRKSYGKHHEKRMKRIRAYSKKYYMAHRLSMMAYAREYYEAHRGRRR